jgi:hypothetical protein
MKSAGNKALQPAFIWWRSFFHGPLPARRSILPKDAADKAILPVQEKKG